MSKTHRLFLHFVFLLVVLVLVQVLSRTGHESAVQFLSGFALGVEFIVAWFRWSAARQEDATRGRSS